ncbi:MAG: dihydroneopterin aldolase [Bacillaceae bacterium]|nr:dihydroneopterin aldolase [Bacillaceae bacterium]
MDRIFLNGLDFYGYHGVFAEEQKLGQRFVLDIVLLVDLKQACDSDELRMTVNYGEVYEKVKSIVEGKPFKLIEALAGKVSQEILGHFSLVQSCIVKVTKMNPPINGHYHSVSVEIERSRHE